MKTSNWREVISIGDLYNQYIRDWFGGSNNNYLICLMTTAIWAQSVFIFHTACIFYKFSFTDWAQKCKKKKFINNYSKS